MNISLDIAIEHGSDQRIDLRRRVEWPGVPSVGDRVNVGEGGPAHTVVSVEWCHDGSVLVDLGRHNDEVTFAAKLEREGWKVVGDW